MHQLHLNKTRENLKNLNRYHLETVMKKAEVALIIYDKGNYLG